MHHVHGNQKLGGGGLIGENGDEFFFPRFPYICMLPPPIVEAPDVLAHYVTGVVELLVLVMLINMQ